jgi:hypothetical protein
VPGELQGVGFAKFGEGLSVSKDANLVSFWGTWGQQTFPKTLYCPMDGNKDIKAYCEQHSEGQDSRGFYSIRQIPVNQGIFVYDVKAGTIQVIAKTADISDFSDFLYWVYSGAPPGVGGGHEGESEEGEDREPPRWRSSAFAAVSLVDRKTFAVAFKATQDVPGIFLSENAGVPQAVVRVGDAGWMIDPLDAPDGAVVTAVGIERDGFRGANLGITASMLNAATESMSGIYLTKVR